MEFCAYILYSASLDKYYVGFTDNIEKRLQYQNNPIETRKFTARRIPWELTIRIACPDKSSAIKLEKYIKAERVKILLLTL